MIKDNGLRASPEKTVARKKGNPSWNPKGYYPRSRILCQYQIPKTKHKSKSLKPNLLDWKHFSPRSRSQRKINFQFLYQQFLQTSWKNHRTRLFRWTVTGSLRISRCQPNNLKKDCLNKILRQQKNEGNKKNK